MGEEKEGKNNIGVTGRRRKERGSLGRRDFGRYQVRTRDRAARVTEFISAFSLSEIDDSRYNDIYDFSSYRHHVLFSSSSCKAPLRLLTLVPLLSC